MTVSRFFEGSESKVVCFKFSREGCVLFFGFAALQNIAYFNDV